MRARPASATDGVDDGTDEVLAGRHRTAERHRRLLENAPAHTTDLSPELAERWADAVTGWLTIFDDEDAGAGDGDTPYSNATQRDRLDNRTVTVQIRPR